MQTPMEIFLPPMDKECEALGGAGVKVGPESLGSFQSCTGPVSQHSVD